MIRMLGCAIENWPKADRVLWLAAITPSMDPWSAHGAAAALRAKTMRNYARAYGIFLAHLASIDQLIEGETPAQRPTPQRVWSWLNAMRALGRENGAIKGNLMNLHSILKFIARGYETDFILRPGGRSLTQLFPTKGKPSDPHDTADLLQHVYRLHARGMAERPGLRRYILLRDAAIMGVLYSRAPRNGDLGRMPIGVHLRTLPDGDFLIRFPAETTKSKRNLEYLLDDKCAVIVQDYLRHARPHLRGSALTDHLWMGTTGRALNDIGVTGVVKRRNLDFIGKAEGPHMARKWLTNTARSRSPQAAFDAAETCGHSPQTALRAYAQACDSYAANRHGKHLTKLRREMEGLAERAFAEREATPFQAAVQPHDTSPVTETISK